ncbi:helix-turn-helix domain-containing protein [Paenibacillus sp. MER TA 81-3]
MSHNRSEKYQSVERARMILHYAEGLSISKIAEVLNRT